MPARSPTQFITVELINEWITARRFASDCVSDAFRAHAQLTPREREQIVHVFYGVIHQMRRLDFALDQLSPRYSRGRRHALALYVAYRLFAGEIALGTAEQILPGMNWQRAAEISALIAKDVDPAARLALDASLPDWLAQKLHREYGAEALELAKALSDPPPQCIRVNTLKTTRDAMQRVLDQEKIESSPAPLASMGLLIESHADLFELRSFKEGLFEVQDEASQLVAELVAPSSNQLVIDACAGAGGKTMALGAMMKNHGRLIALDVNARRLEELRRRARRAGLSNLRAIQIGADDAEIQKFNGKADRVLVDAPCSGIGVLRRKPDLRWRVTEEDARDLPEKQFSIARDAMKLCAPNGRLIYATCTILADENERIVERLLSEKSAGTFELVPIKEIIGRARAERVCDSSGQFIKTFPHRQGCDGFFAAVLRKV